MRNRFERKIVGLTITAIALGLCVMVAFPASARQDWVLSFQRVEEVAAYDVEIHPPHPIPPAPITIEAWVKWDGATSDPSHAGIWGRGGGAGPANHWEIRSAGMRVRMVEDDITEAPNPPVDQWAHVAISHDGSVLRYFLNGELVASLETSPGDLGEDPLAIGSSHSNGQRPYGGLIAEFRKWSVARTEQQLQDNMHQRLRGNESGLAGYWRFDEGSGSTATDLTGQWSNGVIGSNVSWVQVDDLPVAPQIVETAPLSQVIVSPGGSGELGPVLLFGEYEADATFQWFKNGDELAGQTGPGLLIDNANIQDHAGTYTVRVNHPDLDEPLEFDVVVRVTEAGVPAAGVAGLLAAGGLIALAGAVRSRRQRH